MASLGLTKAGKPRQRAYGGRRPVDYCEGLSGPLERFQARLDPASERVLREIGAGGGVTTGVRRVARLAAKAMIGNAAACAAMLASMPEAGPFLRKQLLIDQATREVFSKLGDGNLSLGIRRGAYLASRWRM